MIELRNCPQTNNIPLGDGSFCSYFYIQGKPAHIESDALLIHKEHPHYHEHEKTTEELAQIQATLSAAELGEGIRDAQWITAEEFRKSSAISNPLWAVAVHNIAVMKNIRKWDILPAVFTGSLLFLVPFGLGESNVAWLGGLYFVCTVLLLGNFFKIRARMGSEKAIATLLYVHSDEPDLEDIPTIAHSTAMEVKNPQTSNAQKYSSVTEMFAALKEEESR